MAAAFRLAFASRHFDEALEGAGVTLQSLAAEVRALQALAPEVRAVRASVERLEREVADVLPQKYQLRSEADMQAKRLEEQVSRLGAVVESGFRDTRADIERLESRTYEAAARGSEARVRDVERVDDGRYHDLRDRAREERHDADSATTRRHQLDDRGFGANLSLILACISLGGVLLGVLLTYVLGHLPR